MQNVRVAVHVHSDWSYDGSWSLPEIAGAFARRRYKAVLMAEHDRGFDEQRWRAYCAACRELSDGDFLIVPGMEYGDARDVVHILTWGELPFFGECLDTGHLLAQVRNAGGLTVFAHPLRRRAISHLKPEWAASLDGIELWNRKYDGWAPCQASSELLARSDDLIPFVGLDFHTARQFFPLAMILEVEGALTISAVLEALRRRRSFSEVFRLRVELIEAMPLSAAVRIAELTRRRLAHARRVWQAAMRSTNLSS